MAMGLRFAPATGNSFPKRLPDSRTHRTFLASRSSDFRFVL